jgi:hypothetical protein
LTTFFFAPNNNKKNGEKYRRIGAIFFVFFEKSLSKMRQKPVGSENIRHAHVEEINLINTCQISAPESKNSPREADVRPPRLRRKKQKKRPRGNEKKNSKKNGFLGSYRTPRRAPGYPRARQRSLKLWL